MAKDPAFLFYSSDFITGTLFMSNEQVGSYIRLLCMQHQKGHLTEKDMLYICKSYDEDVFSKFTKDNEGKYYNERCENEINKRKSYSESRANNRKGADNKEVKQIKEKKHMINISKTYDKHMENEIKNEDVIKNKTVIKNRTIQKQNLLFKDSEYYILENLVKGLSESKPPYCEANAEYYYNSMENWSESKGEKKIDWLATCKNWILRDFKEGKLIDKNYKVQQHGKSNYPKTAYTNGTTPFDNWSNGNGTK